jgi:voltage-gated potassium channel
MVKLEQFQHDYATFRRIFVTIVLLVLLIGIGSYVIYQDTGNIQGAVVRSMELVTHVEVPRGEPHSGLMFVLSFGGAILSVYIILVIINIFYTGRFKKGLEEARILKKIKKMTDHYVILGGGSLGTSVAASLKEKGKDVVVLEADNERVNELNHKGIAALEGDCFDREYLETVGLPKARMVMCCLNDDGDNLLTTLIAKDMNPNAKVVAEATFEKFAVELRKAGADRVIVPRKISGSYMAEVAVGL